MKFHFKNSAEFAQARALLEIPGQVATCLVLHDDACSPLVCRCEPEFIVETEPTEESLAKITAMQAKWAKESLS
jgi:hypothetical protein